MFSTQRIFYPLPLLSKKRPTVADRIPDEPHAKQLIIIMTLPPLKKQKIVMTWFWERRNDVFLLNARIKYYYSIIRIHRYLPPFLFGLFVFHGGGGGGPDSGRCSCGTIIIAVAHTNGRIRPKTDGEGEGRTNFHPKTALNRRDRGGRAQNRQLERGSYTCPATGRLEHDDRSNVNTMRLNIQPVQFIWM